MGEPHGRERRGWLVPAFAGLRGYRRAWLRGDLLAGVTVAAFLVPQVMAYAQVAGVPPVAGLWAALPALVVYAALGSSRSLSMGPESTTALMTAVAIGPLAAGNPARYAELAARSRCWWGCCRWRRAGCGWASSRICCHGRSWWATWPGVALIMIAGQLGRVTGVPVSGEHFAAEVSVLCKRHGLASSRDGPWPARCWCSFSWCDGAGRTRPARCWPCCWPPQPWRRSGWPATGPRGRADPGRPPVPQLPDVHWHELRELLLPAVQRADRGFQR